MIRSLAAGAALVAALALPGAAVAKETVLTAQMDGKQETPDKGDAGGNGVADITLGDAKGTVCFVLTYRGIDKPTAGHIHAGAKGKAGPVKVTLFSGSFKKKGCTRNVDASLIRSIAKRPKSFYVNFHNAAFAGGAVRGQLAVNND